MIVTWSGAVESSLADIVQVFDAVAAEAAKQQIWVHLDNHVSKAQWCCSETDGNTWFGDTNFPSYQWQRGLGFMANRVG